MPTATKAELDALAPYLAGAVPDETGEVELFCPLHDDAKRSASINVEKGVWYCHAGCGGGSVRQLVANKDAWVSPEGRVSQARPSGSRRNGHSPGKVSEAAISSWHDSLLSDEERIQDLFDARGITLSTIRDFEIGYDAKAKAYTIPVRGPKGKVWNVRRYDMAPTSGRRKIWSIKGMGAARLYPYSVANAVRRAGKRDRHPQVIICEGEWDALLTIQHGFDAVTRTGAAKVWDPKWARYFEGADVFLCHDCDEAGVAGNRIVAESLKDVANSIRLLRLPYAITEKHGKDLTDFWLDYHEHGASEMQALMDDAQIWSPEYHEPEPVGPEDASVIDSFDSRRVGEAMRLTVTIKGKREPGYSVPRHVVIRCGQDAGARCQVCPMNALGGEDDQEIAAGDPVLLEMVDAPKSAVKDAIRQWRGIPKCTRFTVEPESHQAVEVLFARPSVDQRSEEAADYKNMKVLSSGRHDTMPNNTVQVVGALYPNPRTQGNEFLAWDVQKMETSLDNFVLDGGAVQRMRSFQVAEGERPLRKLGTISRAMAAHVTQIFGRPEMHAAMDLVFHSALSFDFDGQRIEKGWLELLIIGDTRTGKSEVARKLSRHYAAGEIVSCESATFAGVVGGLQQYGSSKEWAVTWGAVPINDRRLVVLDEVSGLSQQDIGAMSSVRSSGTAELTKIQSERTFARTRLIWLGNPRGGSMGDYTYGVQAIRPLIGNDEDIARFDLAMSVVKGEVPSEIINRFHRAGRMIYPSEACADLVRWAWSRKPEQIVWEDGADGEVLRLAEEMGRRYVESPPLVQAANIRIKLAKIAVALAARLFSTDTTYEYIVVRPEHVQDAVAFLDRIYSMTNFGYAERSEEIIGDRLSAEDHALNIERYLEEHPGLAKFLRTTGRFRRNDLEEIMNLSREETNGIINVLWDARMVRKDGGDIRVEPPLHAILRRAN